MSLTGTSKRGPAVLAQAAPAIRLTDLLDQLEHEYSTLRLEDPASDMEVALRAYFHTACHVALYWFGGDPYRWAAPAAFQGERLWKLCLYLRSLDPENSQALKEARAAQLTQLRGPAWENYQATCTPLQTQPYQNGERGLDREILPFTWEGIDTLWQTDESLKALPADKAPDYLPRFACRASEDWHLVCLAVLFLNRACKLRLADLHPYPTGDGR